MLTIQKPITGVYHINVPVQHMQAIQEHAVLLLQQLAGNLSHILSQRHDNRHHIPVGGIK